MNDSAQKSGWPPAVLALSVLLSAVGFLYIDTLAYLISMWNEVDVGEYAHGYLVVVISIYLVWVNRGRLAQVSPQPAYAILPLLAAAIFLWLLAKLVDVEMLQAVALLGILFTLVWAVCGHQAMRLLAFPVAFLSFAIPMWFPLSPVLQEITTDIVFWVARLFDIPAMLEENVITVPSGVFSVEEACSGLRYFLAAMTLGSLYAYLNYRSLKARIAVVSVAASAAVLANFIRVYIVVYLGYATEMQHPWVHDHLMLGWYLFGGLVALLLFADARLYRHDGIESVVDSGTGLTTASGHKTARQFIIVSILAASLIIAAPAFLHRQSQLVAVDTGELVLPGGIAGWQGPGEDSNNWQPQYHGAVSAKADYLNSGERVSLYVAYYASQAQGAEVINDLNRISNKKVWRTVYSHPRQYSTGTSDNDVTVLEQLLENANGRKRVLWYWYNFDGQVTTNRYKAKVLQLLGVFTGKPQAYMVAVSTMMADDREQARSTLNAFIRDMQQPLKQIKPE